MLSYFFKLMGKFIVFYSSKVPSFLRTLIAELFHSIVISILIIVLIFLWLLLPEGIQVAIFNLLFSFHYNNIT